MFCCVVLEICKVSEKMKLLWRWFCSLVVGRLLCVPTAALHGDAHVWRISLSAMDWKSSSFWFVINAPSLLLLFKLDVILRSKKQTGISLTKMIRFLFSPFSPPDYSDFLNIIFSCYCRCIDSCINDLYIIYIITIIIYIIYIGVRYSVTRNGVMQRPWRHSGLRNGTDRVNFHSLQSNSCLCPYIYQNKF